MKSREIRCDINQMHYIYIHTQILHNLLLDTIAMLRIAKFLHENVNKIKQNKTN